MPVPPPATAHCQDKYRHMVAPPQAIEHLGGFPSLFLRAYHLYLDLFLLLLQVLHPDAPRLMGTTPSCQVWAPTLPNLRPRAPKPLLGADVSWPMGVSIVFTISLRLGLPPQCGRQRLKESLPLLTA